MASSIAEQIIAQVYALLPDGVNTAVGRREIETHAAPPRVVAIPMGAPVIDQPDMPGDARYSDAGRQLLLRRFRIDWSCHGSRDVADATDFAQVESVYIALLRAIRSVAHHSVVFSDERWPDQDPDQDSFERFGSVIEVTTTIDLPVYEGRSVIVGLTADPKIATTATLNENDTETIEQP